jgi:hypothetical protein
MSIAYFIRRRDNVCTVVKVHADNREEIIQDGLSPIEAEILCVAKIEDPPRPQTQLIPQEQATGPVDTGTKRHRPPQQLVLKV